MILFVCTGNMFRSAAAEAIARHLGRTGVGSAGTSPHCVEQRAMPTRMRLALEAVGVEPHPHRSRWVADVGGAVTVALGFQPSHIVALSELGLPARPILDIFPANGWRRVPDPGFDSSLCESVVEYLMAAVPVVLGAYPCVS